MMQIRKKIRAVFDLLRYKHAFYVCFAGEEEYSGQMTEKAVEEVAKVAARCGISRERIHNIVDDAFSHVL